MLSGICVTPKGMPISVMIMMLGNRLPRKRIIKNVPVSINPKINNRDDGVARVSRWLNIVPWARIPLFLNPIMATKKPIPAAMAYLSDVGTISKMMRRRLLMQISINNIPSINTAVSANCQG